MIIKGDHFRIIEININNLKHGLYENFFKGPRVFNYLYCEKPIATIYVQIDKKDFYGNEDQFRNISNKRMIEILQDEDEIEKLFDLDSLDFGYNQSRETLLKPFNHYRLGSLATEQISEDYYCYTTKPVKVLLAKQQATVGNRDIKNVNFNDYLMHGNDVDNLNIYTTNEEHFSAYHCDKDGNILSDNKYQAGMELPIFEVNDYQPSVRSNKV